MLEVFHCLGGRHISFFKLSPFDKKVLIEMKTHISIKIFKCSSTTQRVSLVELLAEICDVM